MQVEIGPRPRRSSEVGGVGSITKSEKSGTFVLQLKIKFVCPGYTNRIQLFFVV